MDQHPDILSTTSEEHRSVPATPSIADEQDRLDIARLANGEDIALNDLMDRHAARLFQYLIRSLQNEEDAADLAQETFVRVYQNRARFDPNKKFSTWLYAITTNLVRDRYRWRTRHPQVSLDASNAEPGTDLNDCLPDRALSANEAVQRSERIETVRRAVAALPEQWRVPLILAEYDEKSHAEIAEILYCSAKAVEMRISKAREKLRESLGRLLPTI